MSDTGSEPLMSWIARLFEQPDRPPAAHDERLDDLNLGLGWLYYGLARILHPRRAIVVGSDRFARLVLARAVHDNVESGEVIVVDPSPVEPILRHFPMTTQEFVDTDAYRELGPIGLVFIAGSRAAAQARFDYRAFATRVEPRGVVLFHDSTSIRHVIDDLARDPGLQALDLPFGAGLTLVRRLDEESVAPLLEGHQARLER